MWAEIYCWMMPSTLLLLLLLHEMYLLETFGNKSRWTLIPIFMIPCDLLETTDNTLIMMIFSVLSVFVFHFDGGRHELLNLIQTIISFQLMHFSSHFQYIFFWRNVKVVFYAETWLKRQKCRKTHGVYCSLSTMSRFWLKISK